MTEEQEHEHQLHMADRRHLSLKEVILVSTLLLNFGGLVWGAATMENSLIELKSAVTTLTTSVGVITQQLTSIQIDYNARLRVLETVVNRLEQRDRDKTK